METLIHPNEPVKTSSPVFSTESDDVFASLAEQSVDLNRLLVNRPEATFFVIVEGDSMIDSFIPSKALLLVDRSASARSGDIIVAVLNGEFTVKRLLKTHVGTFLSPANPNYKPVKISKEMNFEVWGVVSRIIIDPKDV
jgi:DNA polymerase V